MPQAKETLKELKKRGLTLGIVSNAQFYTPVILSFLLEQPLEEIFSSNFLVWSFQERRGKPSPLIFKKIIESMRDYQIPIELSLYVGNDMKNDIFTAHANGIPTVLFAGDKRSLRLREEEKEINLVQPERVITSLNQILEIIP